MDETAMNVQMVVIKVTKSFTRKITRMKSTFEDRIDNMTNISDRSFDLCPQSE